MVEFGLALLVLSAGILMVYFLVNDGICSWHRGRMLTIMLSSK